MIKSKFFAATSMAFALCVASGAIAKDKNQNRYDAETLHFTDTSRTIKASMGFAGSEQRRLDVMIWGPASANKNSRHPLLIYSHGTFGQPDNAMHLVHDLVRQGYIVAAPAYPLTSSAAFTQVSGPDISDVHNQPRDISFIINNLLSHSKWGDKIDEKKIGLFGHSLGAVTSYFTVFGLQARDPRIAAMVSLGGGDPVQAALSNDMGLLGTHPFTGSVPALFLSAEHDVFANLTGQPYAAYSRLKGPKYEVMVDKGTHVWFRDSVEKPDDGRNPDCIFFDKAMPGVPIPGCQGAVELMEPLRQQALTRYAVSNFFDAYLRDNTEAKQRLSNIANAYPETSLRSEP